MLTTGQKIRCHDRNGHTLIAVGGEYVVRGFCTNGLKPDLVSLEGVNGWFSQSIFTPVTG